uniref:Uncharacterized protein n=2 Tax=Clytia hemisphaerica TaxID=252671 RepID=A0A7M5WYT5_9CNID
MAFHSTTHRPAGDRVPTLLILPNQLNVEVATQIGWNGNWHNKGINLQENKWHTIKMEQKKEADENYYFYIHFDGQQMAKQHQDIPREKHNVKVWASDIFHEAGGVIIKDLLFQNKKGSFDECKAVCNKPLSDQDFDVFFDRTQKQETVIYENAAVMTPTKNSLVKENFEVGQEYELSMEIKAKEKKGGWTNIVHVTSGENCCDKGMRVPAVFIYSNDYKMHITAPVNHNGNHAYDGGRLKQDE